ncbi:MAG TPA: Xaa-Pro peptidase family protein [Mycobacteriales bacterium]|nr:Xaa-Pro peptidase family protein [Mycobacteriales bacterium]
MADTNPDPSAAVRRDRLRAAVRSAGLDAALVTKLVNVRYLTGFTGSNGALLIGADGTDVLCTDGRYTLQSARQAPDVQRLIDRASAPALATRAAERGLRRLGYESHDVTVDLAATLTDRAGGAELVSLAEAVERLRAAKDDAELALLRQACAIADRALAELIAAGGIAAGRTELAVGRDLDNRMLGLGADAPSFETIVASGPNSAVPHHRPTGRELVTGDFVKLDFGATYGGYHSDMTRTLVLGPPAGWQREVYELVAVAQAAGRAALAPGADVVEVDRAARDVIVAAGHGDNFGHGLGHGVGLEIHEAPTVSQLGSGRLADRMPVTVEPGVYLEGRGGVRIEDTLVVRPDGPELLTTTTKDLIVL